MTKMVLTAGLDVGNGYLKGLIEGSLAPGVDEIDIPAGVALTTRPNYMPTADESAPQLVAGRGNDSIYNHLDASFLSPMVEDNWRRLFGMAGITSGSAMTEFDVLSKRSKAEQSLSKILVLGCFAAKALKDYVTANGAMVPAGEVLAVEAHVALALPISEYMTQRQRYAADFMGTTHQVTIQNFATPVTVSITFEKVTVSAEGASAQRAITDKGEPLMKVMLKDVRSRGLALEGVTAADVLAANNSIGVDIGEGTVNFPVMTNGLFNPQASTTFTKGYGSVLMGALASMEARNVRTGFTSRKQLAAYLQTPPNPLRRAAYEQVKAFVEEETIFFANEVAEQFGRVLASNGVMTDVIYVYGGGSGQVKDVLYDLLIAKSREINGTEPPPVLYLDASYSRNLNREGLFIVAKNDG